jgi:hypothetical protein
MFPASFLRARGISPVSDTLQELTASTAWDSIAEGARLVYVGVGETISNLVSGARGVVIVVNVGSGILEIESLDAYSSISVSPGEHVEFEVIAAGGFQFSINELSRSSFGTTPDSSETVKGKVELATDSETSFGTDALRAVVPRAMRRAILDDVFVADILGASTSAAGSGSVSTSGGNPGPGTGATANSEALATWVFMPCQGTSSWANVNYSRPQSVSIRLTRGSSGVQATGIYRFGIGGSARVATIAANGFFCEIRGARLWIVAHNGTSLSQQDTGVDIGAAFAPEKLRVESDGAGNISLWRGATQVGTTMTGGPTNTNADGVLHLYNANGATAASNDIRFLRGSLIAWTN